MSFLFALDSVYMTVHKYLKNELQIIGIVAMSSTLVTEDGGIWPASHSQSLFISPVPGINWLSLLVFMPPSLEEGLTETKPSMTAMTPVQVAGSFAHPELWRTEVALKNSISVSASCCFHRPTVSLDIMARECCRQ